MGCARSFQALKSPTTLTARAAGAHTAKAVPGVPSIVCGCAPSASQSCSWRPSVMRWRSSSPSVGRNEYGSRSTTGGSVRDRRPRGGSAAACACAAARPRRRPPRGPARARPARPVAAARARTAAPGRNARTTMPPSPACAPSTVCGSGCSPAAMRSISCAAVTRAPAARVPRRVACASVRETASAS